MSDALRHRGFGRLWLGDVVSMIGDWLTYVAVGVLAVDGGGALAVLGVLLAHTLPRAVLAPWAGWVADRCDRRLVLALGSAARGLAVLGMAIAAACSAPAVVAVLLVLRMALGAFVDAAAGAAVPRLVPAAELPRAHGLLGATWSVVFSVGVAAGGLLTAALGPVTALLVDALTFFVAAAIFWGLPPLRPLGERDGAAVRGGFGEALGFLRSRPAVRRAALTKLPVMIANGGAWMLVHAIAGRDAGLGVALALGGLHLARALGTGLGSLAWARIAVLRGSDAGLRVARAVVLAGAAGLAFAGSPVAWAAAALVWGLGIGSHWATAAARLQQLTPDPLRGRTTAIDLVAHTVGQCAGGALGWVGLLLAASHGGAPVSALAPALLGAAVVWAWLERSTSGETDAR
jgi:predicted MFS family arabinose efflux permease